MNDRGGSIGPPGSGESDRDTGRGGLESPPESRPDARRVTPPRLVAALGGLAAVVFALVIAWPSGGDDTGQAGGPAPTATTAPPVPGTETNPAAETNPAQPPIVPATTFTGTKTVQTIGFSYGTSNGPTGVFQADGVEYPFSTVEAGSAIFKLSTEKSPPFLCTFEAGRATGCAPTADSDALPQTGDTVELRVISMQPQAEPPVADDETGFTIRAYGRFGDREEEVDVRVNRGSSSADAQRALMRQGGTYRCAYMGFGNVRDCR